MKFRYSPVALAVFAALGSAGLTPVAAQQAQPQPQSLERVTVTGTNIRRTDQETVSPVEIITREQIERTGQPTVSDVLKAIPQSLGSLGESFSNSFAPGAQGISRVRGPEECLVDRFQVRWGAGAEEITPALGEVAVVHHHDPAAVGPEIGAEARAGPAKGAEVRLDDFFFQVLGTLDFRAHLFLPFLVRLLLMIS